MAAKLKSTDGVSRVIANDALSLVFGFMRRAQTLLRKEISDDLSRLCTIYFVKDDYFAEHGDSYIVESHDMLITKAKVDNDGGDFALGNVSVHSLTPKVHCWTFQVLNCGFGMTFGIRSEDETTGEGRWVYGAKHPGHKFIVKEGSVIKMLFTYGSVSTSKQLVFCIDGNWLGPAHSNIKCGEHIFYKMYIILESQENSVRLINYSEA